MPFIASAAAAALLALALPSEIAPYGIPVIGFFCLAPHFAAIGRSRSYLEAAILGFIFGTLSHFLSSYWLMNFQDYAIWTIGATSVAYGFLHIFLAAFLRRFSLIGGAARPFAIAAVWAVWECLKSIGFLGYPWGLVAYSVNAIDILNQIADATGVYGISFLMALSSAVIVEAVKGTATRRTWGVFAAVVLWIAVYGVFAVAFPTPTIDRVPLVLVQHNEDSWAQGGESRAIKKCQDLSRKGIGEFRDGTAKVIGAESGHYGDWTRPALIVWSETVLRRPFDDYRPYFRKHPTGDPFIPFLAEAGVPVLTGAPVILDWNTYDATNSAILISPDGEILGSYAKSHLVPFAESIPLWEHQWMRDLMKKLAGLEGQWVAGKEATVMTVQTPSGRPLSFGVPICFEDAFADTCSRFFRNGADLLINITNDAWSQTVSAETQHLVASRYRAIENRRVLVRSTNGGVTAVVDAEGRVAASLPLFTEDALAVTVPVQKRAGMTTYAMIGDWFPLFLAAALLILLAADLSEDGRRRRSMYGVSAGDLEPLYDDL